MLALATPAAGISACSAPDTSFDGGPSGTQGPLATTHFSGFEEWTVPSPPWAGERGLFAPGVVQVGFAGQWALIDMDGDELPDVIMTHPAESPHPPLTAWQLYRNTGAGFDEVAIPWPTPPPEASGETDFYQLSNPVPGVGSVGWDTVDLDGDGLPDLVVTSDDVGQPLDGGSHWMVFRGTGAGFEPSPLIWPTPDISLVGERAFYLTENRHPAFPRWSLRDLNGDERPDLIVTSGVGLEPLGDGQWQVFWNHGAGFESTPWPWSTPPRELASPYGFYAPEQQAEFSDRALWSLLDMDGDGRPDLVLTSSAGVNPLPGNKWEVYRNDGSRFLPTPIEWSLPTREPGGAIGFVVADAPIAPGFSFWSTFDIDSDGRPDLVLTSDTNGSELPGAGRFAWWVYTNHGAGFEAEPRTFRLPEADDVGDWGFWTPCAPLFTSRAHWKVLDLTGDGRVDLVYSSSRAGVPEGFPERPYWRVAPGAPD